MPDISQIVPLTRELNISADVLLGIVDEDDSNEFDAIYRKCMEIESCNSCNWPPEAEKAEKGFEMMYDFFSHHPNNARAAKYLLDITELYWGKFHVYANEEFAVKECERFANCIFRHSDDADLQAEARFLIAAVWTRIGRKDKAEAMLEKMPFRYGDRCYWSAEVAKKGGDWEKAEMLCRESFTYRARYISKCLRLLASLPNKALAEKTAYEEYLLRLVNAFLTGGDYMPHRQMYQKCSILVALIKHNADLGNIDRAIECFEDLIETSETYLAFLDSGSKGTTLLLLDDERDTDAAPNKPALRREMPLECLYRAIHYGEQILPANERDKIQKCIDKANAIRIKNIS